MLWGLLIMVAAGLLFVIFHKPPVNPAGAHWMPPQQRVPAAPSTQVTAEGSGAVPQPQPAKMPDTFDFNDLFKAQPQKPNDEQRS